MKLNDIERALFLLREGFKTNLDFWLNLVRPPPPNLGPVIRSIFLLPVSNLHPSKHETVLKDNCITSDVPGKMQTKLSNSLNVLEELRGGW